MPPNESLTPSSPDEREDFTGDLHRLTPAESARGTMNGGARPAPNLDGGFAVGTKEN